MSCLALAPGCILPTPLEQQKQSTTYPPPIILTDLTTPPIGRLRLSLLDSQIIDVTAEDINPNLPGAVLHAALLVQLPGKPIAPSALTPIELSQKDAAHNPFLYGAAFPSTQFCIEVNDGTLLWLYVSDANFNADDPTKTAGQVDKQHWELQCTQ